MFMDEVTQKWGFGSGISLFIAAGVSWRLFTSLFQFLGRTGGFEISGRALVLINALIKGNTDLAASAFAVIFITLVIFLAIIWAQSLKVELPLSYDRLRGYNVKWPLAFFYASVIPVILVSALAANVQLFAGMFENWLGHATFLGGLNEFGTPVSGLAFWIGYTDLLSLTLGGGLRNIFLFQGFFHILFYVFFSALFSVLWVKTSGMDAESQAKNIMSSGLQIPGFRKDPRILESVLNRYIMPLTVMGGAAIGLIAAFSNLVGALVGGTAILLLIMIMYQFYQNIAQQHAVDMNPAMKKFMGK
jgi:preprotein translocase subunit SecY